MEQPTSVALLFKLSGQMREVLLPKDVAHSLLQKDKETKTRLPLLVPSAPVRFSNHQDVGAA